VATAVFALTATCIAVGVVYTLLAPPASSSFGTSGVVGGVLYLAAFATFPVTGLLVARRQPGNAVGWVMLGAGLAWGLDAALSAFGGWAIERGGKGGALAFALDQPLWVPMIGLAGVWLLLLFPDGHLPSPRWRWFARGVGAGMAILFVLMAITPATLADVGFPDVANPLAIEAAAPLLPLSFLALLSVPIGMLGGAVAVIGRYRRARGVERLQLRWLASAAALVATIYALTLLVGYVTASDRGSVSVSVELLETVVLVSFALIPASIGVAVLRYRLYDIDLLISKTLVFGVLAGFITVVYVAVVAGLGSVFDDSTDPVLSIGATITVALLFGPVRARVRRWANRMVYGRRATPYEVMAGFSRRVSGTLSVTDVLPAIAEAAATGVGAAQARVRVFLPGSHHEERWPPEAGAADAANDTLRLDVAYRGEPVGEIEVDKPPNDPITPAERSLLEDLALHAGLALHNVRLTDELALRTAEVRDQTERLAASRERLVTARDEQRRRLEREIREGPAADLVGIREALARCAQLSQVDPAAADALLDRLGERSAATLERLRDLARGIFPPLLVDEGVVAALEAHIRKVGADARVEVGAGLGGRRLPAEIEACLYFCCVQAIQNVMRHGGGARTAVLLDLDGAMVSFEVTDEGPGFDQATTPRGAGRAIMQDRVEALEGSLEVRSAPGEGTVVRGLVPFAPVEVPA
jgi:signal transduction histidine kinase